VVADVVLVTVAPTGWRAAALGGGNAIGMTIAGVLLLVFLERTAGRSALVGAGRGFGVGLVVGGAAAAAGLGLTALLGSGAVALVVTTAAAGLVACGVWAVLDRAALMQLLKRRGAPR
jgi:putative peptidoglycan lipid II flippase